MADTLNLIKTVTADGSSATMDTGTLTGNLDVLRVVVEIEGGGSGGCRMRFNSDTGNNYRRLFSENGGAKDCLLYTSPSPRDLSTSRMPSSA